MQHRALHQYLAWHAPHKLMCIEPKACRHRQACLHRSWCWVCRMSGTHILHRGHDCSVCNDGHWRGKRLQAATNRCNTSPWQVPACKTHGKSALRLHACMQQSFSKSCVGASSCAVVQDILQGLTKPTYANDAMRTDTRMAPKEGTRHSPLP